MFSTRSVLSAAAALSFVAGCGDNSKYDYEDAVVSGLILDEVTRLPVSGAVVTITSGNGVRETETDENGHFYIKNVPTFSYNLLLTVTAKDVLDPSAVAAAPEGETEVTTTYSSYSTNLSTSTHGYEGGEAQAVRQIDLTGDSSIHLVKPVGAINVQVFAQGGFAPDGTVVFARCTNAPCDGGVGGQYLQASTVGGVASFTGLAATWGWVVGNVPDATYDGITSDYLDLSTNVAVANTSNTYLNLLTASSDLELVHSNLFSVPGRQQAEIAPGAKLDFYFSEAVSRVDLDCYNGFAESSVPMTVAINGAFVQATPVEAFHKGMPYGCSVFASTASGELVIGDALDQTASSGVLNYGFTVTSPTAPGAITVAFSGSITDDNNDNKEYTTFEQFVDADASGLTDSDDVATGKYIGSLYFEACYTVNVSSLDNLTHLTVHGRNNEALSSQADFLLDDPLEVEWVKTTEGDTRGLSEYDEDLAATPESFVSDGLDLRYLAGTATTLAFCITEDALYEYAAFNNPYTETSEFGVVVAGHNAEEMGLSYNLVSADPDHLTFSNVDTQTYTLDAPAPATTPDSEGPGPM